MKVFEYGEKEINYLKSKDEYLAKVIQEIGMIKRPLMPNPFIALISSIVSQQISNQAYTTVWNRFNQLLCEVTPETILMTSKEDIQKCGMSVRKVEYIVGIAKAVSNKELLIDQFETMDDEEIISALTTLKGVGRWTAEMLLIFSLNRMNVLSFGDLAIKRGIMKLYGLTTLTKQEFNTYKERYSPYASVASLYLWEIS